MARSLLVLFCCAALGGCASGPSTLQEERLRFNDAVKVTGEEQLLLNVVRLRYSDNPSSLAVTSIAMQTETVRSLGLVPFFGAVAGGADFRSFSGVLPQGQVQLAERPTITMTPLDDGEFTRRLFTPISIDGVLFLAKTTWPIATVFRLWLENFNWVANAQTASGPTSARAPDFAEFRRGVGALQVLQDRAQLVVSYEEREEEVSSGLPAAAVLARDILAAAKDGYAYRPAADGKTWTLLRKRRVPVLRIHPDAVKSEELRVAAEALRLRRDTTTFEIEAERTDPFAVAPRGHGVIDLETRSLLQVLYYVSKGVDVPEAHLRERIVASTYDGEGRVFNWRQVTDGLFHVRSTDADRPPPNAHVAVKYLGQWFYIDRRDTDTMATFSLLVALARLELPSRVQSPVFTLPLGGR